MRRRPFGWGALPMYLVDMAVGIVAGLMGVAAVLSALFVVASVSGKATDFHVIGGVMALLLCGHGSVLCAIYAAIRTRA